MNHTEEDVRQIRRHLGIPEGEKGDFVRPHLEGQPARDGGGLYLQPEPGISESFGRALGEEYVVVFRVHYLVASTFSFGIMRALFIMPPIMTISIIST